MKVLVPIVAALALILVVQAAILDWFGSPHATRAWARVAAVNATICLIWLSGMVARAESRARRPLPHRSPPRGRGVQHDCPHPAD